VASCPAWGESQSRAVIDWRTRRQAAGDPLARRTHSLRLCSGEATMRSTILMATAPFAAARRSSSRRHRWEHHLGGRPRVRLKSRSPHRGQEPAVTGRVEAAGVSMSSKAAFRPDDRTAIGGWCPGEVRSGPPGGPVGTRSARCGAWCVHHSPGAPATRRTPQPTESPPAEQPGSAPELSRSAIRTAPAGDPPHQTTHLMH